MNLSGGRPEELVDQGRGRHAGTHWRTERGRERESISGTRREKANLWESAQEHLSKSQRSLPFDGFSEFGSQSGKKEENTKERERERLSVKVNLGVGYKEKTACRPSGNGGHMQGVGGS